MKSNKFMVVETISPISLIHHHHQFHHHELQLQSKEDPRPHPSIVEQLGKLQKHHQRQIRMGPSVGNGVKSDDLFKCMKTFLIFGKCIGLIPISGIFGTDLNRLKFRKCSISGLISLLVILILCCNTVLALAGYLRGGGRDATQLAKNLAGSVCYSMGLYVFIFIYRNSQKLIDILHRWREVDSNDQNIPEDTSLHLSINLIAGAILTSAIAENAVSHLLLFPLMERVPNPLEYYYTNSHKQWSEMIPYHWSAAMGVFLCNKWAVYAWNFGDLLIATISRALYGKFKKFAESAEERLLKSSKGKLDWLHAIEHHTRLCKLTEEIAALLSPLVFTSFAVNIYFICIQLHLFLAPSKRQDFVAALYSTWSFLHLTARTYTVALSAAKINDYAHSFHQLLCDCPRELYGIDIERAERKLASKQVGLNGLGAFSIGRPFILSVISVIFTFEIVLLQTTQMVMPGTIGELGPEQLSATTTLSPVADLGI